MIPGGVNSVCPTSHSKNATLLKLVESLFASDLANVLFPVRLGPLTRITEGSREREFCCALMRSGISRLLGNMDKTAFQVGGNERGCNETGAW